MDVYLEVGRKRTFAGAIEWPGWCRSGRDEESALRTLFDYGRRYVRALGTGRLGFLLPESAAAFVVVERLPGNATTDFGAPAIAPSSDQRPVDDAELEHLTKLLQACWRAFDGAVLGAQGKELCKGPRGGGRASDEIVRHVLESDGGYLARLGSKAASTRDDDPHEAMRRTREAVLEALASAAAGDVPARGPRGGVRWTARYFVRRVAWHVLDHAWEIEDRTPAD